MLAGYRVIYKPEHFHLTLNQKAYKGYVYEHRYIMECALGRALSSNEIVHHKDGNRLNNSLDNLELMTRSEHSTLHNRKHPKVFCVDCGKELGDYRAKRCTQCSRKNRRKVKDRPPKDVLKRMVEQSSYSAVGRKFGVSATAIRKWLK